MLETRGEFEYICFIYLFYVGELFYIVFKGYTY